MEPTLLMLIRSDRWLYLTRSRMRRFTFSPNASGVGANVGTALIAPTPLALGLNVSLEAA